ncbi:MAG: hypothetical protein C4524_11355 [Candidatus Zixiibacteriota bacterium]|nr:MAG: hypothetical protein C4524_11355 [candidate division Zixibacteria bacterium]
MERFDSQDLGEELEAMPEANFEVDLQRKQHLFVLDAETAGKVQEIARKKRVPSQKLIEDWLHEKINEVG